MLFARSLKSNTPAIILAFSLASCLPTQTQAPSETGGEVFGVSPKTVLVRWRPSSTADSYELIEQNSTSASILSKSSEAQISGLEAQSFDYVYTVFGKRGFNVRELNPIYVAKFKPWSDFNETEISHSPSPVGNRFGRISWNYAPWLNSGLAASVNAQNNTRVDCAFSSDLSLSSPFDDASAKILSVNATMQSEIHYSISDLPTYKKQLVQCRARFIDGYSSLSKNKLTIDPILRTNVSDCMDAEIDSVYQCTLDSLTPLKGDKLSNATAFRLTLNSAESTCEWITQSGTNILNSSVALSKEDISGDESHCEIKVRVENLASGQDLDNILIPVTVRLAQPFRIFPSFAVRGFAGSANFSVVDGSSVSSRYNAMPSISISGDVITDFGFGNSFFAGENSPFSNSTSGRMYGFHSEGALSNLTGQNTLKGTLVVPQAEITNTSFKTEIGINSADQVSLSSFVSNFYTRTSTGNTYSAFDGFFSKGSAAVNQVNFKMLSSSFINTGLSGQTYRLASPDAVFKFIDTDPANPGTFTPVNLESPSGTQYLSNRFIRDDDPVARLAFAKGTDSPFPILCVGDIYIGRPLLLSGNTVATAPPPALMGAVDIFTDSKGCRIYSNSTIFVQGMIRTFDKDTLSETPLPVQLSSSRGVIFGGSVNGTSDFDRLFNISANPTPNASPAYVRDTVDTAGMLGKAKDTFLIGTAAAGSFQDYIANDAGIINISSPLEDFINDGYVDTDSSGYIENHERINGTLSPSLEDKAFVLVHAPIFIWNYDKKFVGSLIAELALFPKKLDFEAALPKGTPILPMLSGAHLPLKIINNE
jgi:hypothetical protein